jgi:hypothetical protein
MSYRQEAVFSSKSWHPTAMQTWIRPLLMGRAACDAPFPALIVNIANARITYAHPSQQ